MIMDGRDGSETIGSRRMTEKPACVWCFPSVVMLTRDKATHVTSFERSPALPLVFYGVCTSRKLTVTSAEFSFFD